MRARGLNLLVFREGRREESGPELKLALMGEVESLHGSAARDSLVAALLRAGELECGLADAGGGDSAQAFASLTDCLAEALLRGRLPDNFLSISNAACGTPVPERLTIATPEGFAYYALHPLAYARALEKLAALPERLVVLGIRSIGTTLSAVTAAAARLRGSQAQRITVRPAGHPYNRRIEFSPVELGLIQVEASANAAFLIVDEGPGLSGSSFLSVAEALEEAGAARERIILLCGHEPNVEALCSANAAQRWHRFRCVAADGEAPRPAAADLFAGGGQWRSRWFPRESAWPAVWTSMERLKYRSGGQDEPRLFKFAGLGHYGDAVREREARVASAGFGPAIRQESDGFVSYPWIDGRPMAAGDLPARVLVRLAEYCAFRARAFAAATADLSLLQQMAQHNLAELGFDLRAELKLERPVIADGRMQPYEWLLAGGQMLKTDSGNHGDDHFFPGPTDIAWDLAGAVVEWRMSAEQRARFLAAYRSAGGDDAGARIEGFVRAYAVFRCAYCTMAAHAMHGMPEQARLERAAAEYREQLAASLPALSASR
jgi:hypothetical protein